MNNSIEQFFTREKSNQGVVLSLDLPCGSPSGHTITVRGVDSDTFRKTNLDNARQYMDMPEELRTDEFAETETLKTLASLICDWSFDTECNEDNKVMLLREAPYIRDRLNMEASKRENFVKKA